MRITHPYQIPTPYRVIQVLEECRWDIHLMAYLKRSHRMKMEIIFSLSGKTRAGRLRPLKKVTFSLQPAEVLVMFNPISLIKTLRLSGVTLFLEMQVLRAQH